MKENINFYVVVFRIFFFFDEFIGVFFGEYFSGVGVLFGIVNEIGVVIFFDEKSEC